MWNKAAFCHNCSACGVYKIILFLFWFWWTFTCHYTSLINTLLVCIFRRSFMRMFLDNCSWECNSSVSNMLSKEMEIFYQHIYLRLQPQFSHLLEYWFPSLAVRCCTFRAHTVALYPNMHDSCLKMMELYSNITLFFRIKGKKKGFFCRSRTTSL